MKIVGISGSPRNANTDLLLEYSLRAARSIEGIETEVIRLREEEIRYCIGCFNCNKENDSPSGCPVHRDSMDRIVPTLLSAAGVIVASPVYFGGVSAQTKTLMDRTESLLRYTPAPRTAALRNKVGGAIAVGGNRNGGQEATIQAIHHFFLVHDMVVVGTGPDKQPGCYLGAASFSGSDPQRGSTIRDASTSDDIGTRAAQIIGVRVAETVLSMNRAV